MIDNDPPEHTRRRRLVSSGFTPRRVAGHEEFLRATVTELIDNVIDRGACDFVNDIATSIPLRMIATLMGLPLADEDKLLHWSDLFATGATDEAFAEQVIGAVIEWVEYIVGEMSTRNDPEAEDLISLLMFPEGEPMSAEDLIYETMLILVGGDEVAAHAPHAATAAHLRGVVLRRVQLGRGGRWLGARGVPPAARFLPFFANPRAPRAATTPNAAGGRAPPGTDTPRVNTAARGWLVRARARSWRRPRESLGPSARGW